MPGIPIAAATGFYRSHAALCLTPEAMEGGRPTRVVALPVARTTTQYDRRGGISYYHILGVQAAKPHNVEFLLPPPNSRPRSKLRRSPPSPGAHSRSPRGVRDLSRKIHHRGAEGREQKKCFYRQWHKLVLSRRTVQSWPSGPGHLCLPLDMTSVFSVFSVVNLPPRSGRLCGEYSTLAQSRAESGVD